MGWRRIKRRKIGRRRRKVRRSRTAMKKRLRRKRCREGNVLYYPKIFLSGESISITDFVCQSVHQ